MNAVCKYNYDPIAGRLPVELYAAPVSTTLPTSCPTASSRSVVSRARCGLGRNRTRHRRTARRLPWAVSTYVSLLACGGEWSERAGVIVAGTFLGDHRGEIGRPRQTSKRWGRAQRALRQSKWLVEGGQVTGGFGASGGPASR
ncbi:MAG: hypothetical protein U5N53_26925 [Mycobacterium sp.]|nr:hypothetical protein [Mycobacterium sp.]